MLPPPQEAPIRNLWAEEPLADELDGQQGRLPSWGVQSVTHVTHAFRKYWLTLDELTRPGLEHVGF